MFQTIDGFGDERVTYGFFGRRGGVSEGMFSSLNTSLVSGDNINVVQENRRLIAEALEVGEISTLYQCHSADSVEVNAPIIGKIEADAFVTSVPGLALGIQTADCGPVLFIGESETNPVIGAAHAGWGGAVKGVLENTIAKMIEQGARLETIQVAIGPTIGPESYEVSEDFLKPFLEDNAESRKFFTKGNSGKFYFDLPAYIEFRLRRAGIVKIFKSGIDTYKQEGYYFSYRRATHRGEKQYGRQLSVISIR